MAAGCQCWRHQGDPALRPPRARKPVLPGKGVFLRPSQVFPKDPKEFALAGLVRAFSLQLLENLFWSREPQAPYCSWTLRRGTRQGWGQSHQKCKLSENHVGPWNGRGP